MRKPKEPQRREMKRRVVVMNEVGLHARPAKNLVTLLTKYAAEVHIEREDGYRINAKSIIGVLTLAAVVGTELTVIAEGDDAGAALDAVEKLFANGFGESLQVN
jgi:phosphocarrier protein